MATIKNWQDCLAVCMTASSESEIQEAFEDTHNYILSAIDAKDFESLCKLINIFHYYQDSIAPEILSGAISYTEIVKDHISGWQSMREKIEKFYMCEEKPEEGQIITTGEGEVVTLIVDDVTLHSEWIASHNGVLIHFARFTCRGTHMDRGNLGMLYGYEILSVTLAVSKTDPEGWSASLRSDKWEGEWSILTAAQNLVNQVEARHPA